MKLPPSATLYGILDLGYISAAQALAFARQMIAGGVDIVQLRAKKVPVEAFEELATQLAPLFTKANIPFILNDHPELVARTGAAGAHVGQDDLSVAEARRLAGPNAIIGKSTHSVAQAAAGAAEADYIGFGPLFATPTKPDYTPIGLAEIQQVHATTSTPIFCIGGIKLENLPTIITAGARRVVIVSGLLQAPDVADYARAVKKLLPPL
ncbi:MAG TPA: thiamine phosphate synthase [Chthoniobacterales bacterium]|jgi:thiamine-phosphate pyrophosphorylase